MSGSGPTSAELLGHIAAASGMPVAAFREPILASKVAEIRGMQQVIDLLCDPDGARVAEAFLALPPPFRRSLARIARALVAATAAEAAAPRDPGGPTR